MTSTLEISDNLSTNNKLDEENSLKSTSTNLEDNDQGEWEIAGQKNKKEKQQETNAKARRKNSSSNSSNKAQKQPADETNKTQTA